MKLKLIMIALLMVSMVYAQQVPEPKDVATLNKITQEHQNTRKFFSDELSRQQNEFFKSMDSRFDYYETTYNNMLTQTAFKLGLLWGGIVLFGLGGYSVFRTRLDKKKNKRFNDTISQLIKQEVAEALKNVSQTKPFQKPMDDVRQEKSEGIFEGFNVKRPVLEGQRPLQRISDVNVQKQQMQSQIAQQYQQPHQYQQQPIPKKGFFERRREKKAMNRLKQLAKSEERMKKEKEKLMGSLNAQNQPQQPINYGVYQ